MKYDSPGTYTIKLKAVDQCGNAKEVERTIVVEGDVTITGANNVTINQGVGIDLTDGVTATGVSGQSINYSVDPESIEKCDIGEHEVTYTATDGGITETVTRVVTITAINDPTISGIGEPIYVEVGEEFDPLDGVTAKDGNNNNIDVSTELAWFTIPYILRGNIAGTEELVAQKTVAVCNADPPVVCPLPTKVWDNSNYEIDKTSMVAEIIHDDGTRTPILTPDGEMDMETIFPTVESTDTLLVEFVVIEKEETGFTHIIVDMGEYTAPNDTPMDWNGFEQLRKSPGMLPLQIDWFHFLPDDGDWFGGKITVKKKDSDEPLEYDYPTDMVVTTHNDIYGLYLSFDGVSMALVPSEDGKKFTSVISDYYGDEAENVEYIHFVSLKIKDYGWEIEPY